MGGNDALSANDCDDRGDHGRTVGPLAAEKSSSLLQEPTQGQSLNEKKIRVHRR